MKCLNDIFKFLKMSRFCYIIYIFILLYFIFVFFNTYLIKSDYYIFIFVLFYLFS
jgi:hypothetical protein